MGIGPKLTLSGPAAALGWALRLVHQYGREAPPEAEGEDEDEDEDEDDDGDEGEQGIALGSSSIS